MRTTLCCTTSSSRHATPFLHFVRHADRLQTQGDAWFKPSEENVHAGVCLRVDSGNFRLFPYDNVYLEPFEAAVQILNPVVAVKIRSAAIHAALATVYVSPLSPDRLASSDASGAAGNQTRMPSTSTTGHASRSWTRSPSLGLRTLPEIVLKAIANMTAR